MSNNLDPKVKSIPLHFSWSIITQAANDTTPHILLSINHPFVAIKFKIQSTQTRDDSACLARERRIRGGAREREQVRE